MKTAGKRKCVQDGVSQTVRDTYNCIAPQYATQNSCMPDNLAKAAARFAQLLPPNPLVLDLGCGAGRDMSWLSSRGLRVVGVDSSAGMLAQARLRAGLALLQMDMRFLGLRSGRFHGIWCCASLLHLIRRDAPAAVQEMGRVLQAGGTLFLSMQEGVGEGWEQCPYADGERFFARYSEKQIVSLLAGNGFETLATSHVDRVTRKWLQVLARLEKHC